LDEPAMLEIKNHTYFETGLAPAMGKDGLEYAVFAIKGTFDIPSSGAEAAFSPVQVPVTLADEYYGEPGFSSVKYEMDTGLIKPGTDVVLVGSAVPQQTVTRVDVGLQVGPAKKVIRVFGDRRWERSMGRWRMTDPEPFDTMPLVYERAFGGTDDTHEKDKKHGYEPRNPIGTGYAAGRGSAKLEGMLLPNLEDPKQLISGWKDRPDPAGFGFVGRHWQPRVAFGGTYDDAWQEERCPFLPEDFDERFFNGAARGLVTRGHLVGGEAVRVVNASSAGELRFELPRREFEISALIKGELKENSCVLDTVVIEPDERRMMLTWRATIKCPRAFLYIDHVRLKERKTA
jgi:hypothetical protein